MSNISTLTGLWLLSQLLRMPTHDQLKNTAWFVTLEGYI